MSKYNLGGAGSKMFDDGTYVLHSLRLVNDNGEYITFSPSEPVKLLISNGLMAKEADTCAPNAVSIGVGTTASGEYSHAEGASTTASGECSHAEGTSTTASGWYSHAEGESTTATGTSSHAEGGDEVAYSGYGRGTDANGAYSHAEGRGTIAHGEAQHVQGKYNIEDTTNTYAHIVGNGHLDEVEGFVVPSNAHTLDWIGNAWYAGNVTCNNVIIKSSTSGSTKLFKITVNDSGTLSAVAYTA